MLEGERHKKPIADGKQTGHFMVGERGDEASTPWYIWRKL